MKDYYVRITVENMNKLYFGVWRHIFTVICSELSLPGTSSTWAKIERKKITFYFLFRLFLLIPLYLLEILSFIHQPDIPKGILTKFKRSMGYINRQISATKMKKKIKKSWILESANQNRLFGPRDQSFMNCKQLTGDSTIRQYLATNKWNSSYIGIEITI